MAISSALLELLDGSLQAKSKGPGRGSTFTVTFPTAEPAPDAAEPVYQRAVGAAKLKLLLIEDHVDTARALKRLLENRGFRVETAGTVACRL